MLRELKRSPWARVLYVAPSPALGLHVIQWLVIRLASEQDLNSWVHRVGLLHSPYEAPVWPSVSSGKIVCSAQGVQAGLGQFTLAIVDEAGLLLGNLDKVTITGIHVYIVINMVYPI